MVKMSQKTREILVSKVEKENQDFFNHFSLLCHQFFTSSTIPDNFLEEGLSIAGIPKMVHCYLSNEQKQAFYLGFDLISLFMYKQAYWNIDVPLSWNQVQSLVLEHCMYMDALDLQDLSQRCLHILLMKAGISTIEEPLFLGYRWIWNQIDAISQDVFHLSIYQDNVWVEEYESGLGAVLSGYLQNLASISMKYFSTQYESRIRLYESGEVSVFLAMLYLQFVYFQYSRKYRIFRGAEYQEGYELKICREVPLRCIWRNFTQEEEEGMEYWINQMYSKENRDNRREEKSIAVLQAPFASWNTTRFSLLRTQLRQNNCILYYFDHPIHKDYSLLIILDDLKEAASSPDGEGKVFFWDKTIIENHFHSGELIHLNQAQEENLTDASTRTHSNFISQGFKYLEFCKEIPKLSLFGDETAIFSESYIPSGPSLNLDEARHIDYSAYPDSQDSLFQMMIQPYVRMSMATQVDDSFKPWIHPKTKKCAILCLLYGETVSVFATHVIPYLKSMECSVYLPVYHYDLFGQPKSNVSSEAMRYFHSIYSEYFSDLDLLYYTYAFLHSEEGQVLCKEYNVNQKNIWVLLPKYRSKADLLRLMKLGQQLWMLHTEPIQNPLSKVTVHQRNNPWLPQEEVLVTANQILFRHTILDHIPKETFWYRIQNRQILEYYFAVWKNYRWDEKLAIKDIMEMIEISTQSKHVIEQINNILRYRRNR